jgi:hypothetical protein
MYAPTKLKGYNKDFQFLKKVVGASNYESYVALYLIGASIVNETMR